MKNSLLAKLAVPMVLASLVVTILILIIVPNRQEQALERSRLAELHSLAAAFSVSAQTAFAYEDLNTLAGLNQLVREDIRDLHVAITLDGAEGHELMAEFPEGENIMGRMMQAPQDYLVASANFDAQEFVGRVYVVQNQAALAAEIWALTLPLYSVFAIILGLQFVIAMLLWRQVIRPISAAATLAPRLANTRDKAIVAKLQREDEIGILQQALRNLRAKLLRQDRQNRRLFGSLEDLVDQRTAELQRALQAKDTFTASMSHELRTPLHSMTASLDLLAQDSDMDRKKTRYLSIARQSAKNLLLLINDLLDFQRWASEDVSLYQSPTSLIEMIQENIDVASILFEESSIDFQADINVDSDAIVMIDRQRFSQAFLNLTSNARKFTSDGQVIISVESCVIGPQCIELNVSVKDSGVGISKVDLDRLGEPFFQIGSGLNRKYSGTGLGLNIVKRILDQMGSALIIESTLGEGSLFGFKLTLNTVLLDESEGDVAEGIQPKVSRSPQMPRLLYVEDSETNQLVMQAMLDHFGLEASLASSAEEGFELLSTQSFDILLADIQMPVFSGLDLMQWINDSSNLRANLRCFACTANADENASAEFLKAGFDGVLTKPISLNAIEQFVRAEIC